MPLSKDPSTGLEYLGRHSEGNLQIGRSLSYGDGKVIERAQGHVVLGAEDLAAIVIGVFTDVPRPGEIAAQAHGPGQAIPRGQQVPRSDPLSRLAAQDKRLTEQLPGPLVVAVQAIVEGEVVHDPHGLDVFGPKQ